MAFQDPIPPLPAGYTFADTIPPLPSGYTFAKKEEEEEEDDKTFKDYVQQVGEFMSKLPGFAVDQAERLASSLLKLPKQTGQGAEQFNRNKKAIFEVVKKEYETLGLSEESADGLVNILQKVLPIPGKDIQMGFEAAEGVYDIVKDTDTFKSLEQTSQKLYEKSDRYEGKGIVELAKDKDWVAAGGAFLLYGVESLPQSLLAAAGGPGGAAALGLMAGGEKYDELLKREDMSETARMINSNLTMALEAATEYMGSVQVGRIFKDVLAKGGKKQLREVAEKTGRNWMTRLMKKAGVWSAPILEGIEEFVNQLGQNVVAKFTGEDPEREIGDNLLESTLRGMSGGSYFTGAGLSAQGIQKLTERFEEHKEAEIGKPEEPTKVKEEPSDAKSTTPKVTPPSGEEKLVKEEEERLRVRDDVKDQGKKAPAEKDEIKYVAPEEQTETIRNSTHYKSGDKYIPTSTWSHWFSSRDRKSKERIAKEIEDKPELRNALLSSWYDEYIKDTGEDISFGDFLNKEIEVYRGETKGDVESGEPYGFQTFTPTEAEAKVFSETGKIIKSKVKPKDAYGLTQIQGAEREILVPTKYSTEFLRKQWDHFASKNMEIIEKLSDKEAEHLGDLGDNENYQEAIEYLKQKKAPIEHVEEEITPEKQKEIDRTKEILTELKREDLSEEQKEALNKEMEGLFYGEPDRGLKDIVSEEQRDEADRRVEEAKEFLEEETKEPKPGEEVSELATRSTEISRSFGLSGFRVSEGKEGSRTDLAKEDITNWLNKEEEIEVSKVPSEEGKVKIREKFTQQRDRLSQAKFGDVGVMKDIMHDFIQRNKSTIGKIHGRAVPTMLNRVNKANTPVKLRNAMEYIADAMADVNYKEKMEWAHKTEKEVDPARKLETKKSKERVKYSYLNRINEEHIQKLKDITAQIKRGDSETVEEELYELREKEERLREKRTNPEAIEAVRDEMEILEFGRMDNMSLEEIKALHQKGKEINTLGRTQSKINRIASARKGFRAKKTLTDMLGHPKFRRGSTLLRTAKKDITGFLTTFDVDFPALMNQAERISEKNFRWQWDNALYADNNRDINTAKLGKHEEIYNSIESDIGTLKTRISKGLEDNPFAGEIKKDLKDINKTNIESFIDKWHEHVSEEVQGEIDNFTEALEEKYNTIYRKTNAWLPSNFLTGPLQRMFHTELMHKAEEQVARDNYGFLTDLNDNTKRIFKVGINRLSAKLEDLNKTKSIPIPYTDYNGETQYEMLTPFMAIQKWREYIMGGRMDNFTKPQVMSDLQVPVGMGWNEESFKALEESITPEMKEWGEWYVGKLEEIIQEVQPAHLEQYGLSLDLIDKYVPSVVVPEKYTGDYSALLDKQDFVRGISSDRFKKRTQNDNPLAFVSAYDMLIDYATDMIKFKNMSAPIRKLEHTFYHPDVKHHIEDRLSPAHYQHILTYIDRWSGRSKRNNIEIIDDLMGGVSKGMLGLKIIVGSKQTFSVMLYGADAQMSMPELLTGAMWMGNPTKTNKSLIKLLDQQSYFTDRLGTIMGLDIALDVYGGKIDYKNTKAKGLQKAYQSYLSVQNKATKYLPKHQANAFNMMALKYGDRFPAIVGGGPYLKRKYRHFSRGERLNSNIIEKYMVGEPNKALERALEEWSIMSTGTQQSSRTSKVSNLRASGSIWRMVTQFTNAPGQLSRNVMMASRNVLRGRNRATNFKAIALNSVITGALYAWAETGFRTDFDEDDKKELIWRLFLGPFKGIAGWGRVLSLVADVKFDKPWRRSTLSQTPVTDTFYDLVEASVKLGSRDLTPEQEDRYLTQFVKAFATLRGIPADEMIDIYQVAEKAVEGEAGVMELLMLRNPDNTKKKTRYTRGD